MAKEVRAINEKTSQFKNMVLQFKMVSSGMTLIVWR